MRLQRSGACIVSRPQTSTSATTRAIVAWVPQISPTFSIENVARIPMNVGLTYLSVGAPFVNPRMLRTPEPGPQLRATTLASAVRVPAASRMSRITTAASRLINARKVRRGVGDHFAFHLTTRLRLAR
jgi:hypothetical protein